MIQRRKYEDINSESSNQLIQEIEEHLCNPSSPVLKYEKESGHSPEYHKAVSRECTEANKQTFHREVGSEGPMTKLYTYLPIDLYMSTVRYFLGICWISRRPKSN